MPNLNQINFINENVDLLIEPILIVGSKEYKFDKYNFINELTNLNKKEIIGVDIQSGSGVDIVLDICDSNNRFFKEYAKYFNTIICMQTFYAVKNPFIAAENICKVMNIGSALFFSDAFIHKIARMPKDYWRFSYDAHKLLFHKLKFDEEKVKVGITRQNLLIKMTYPLPELSKYNRNNFESSFEYILRKIFRKIYSKSLLNISRLFPEITIFSISIKIDE